MRKIKKKLGIFLLIIIIIIIIVIIILKIINKKITPVVMEYSISEMKRVASIIINRSVNSDLL